MSLEFGSIVQFPFQSPVYPLKIRNLPKKGSPPLIRITREVQIQTTGTRRHLQLWDGEEDDWPQKFALTRLLISFPLLCPDHGSIYILKGLAPNQKPKKPYTSWTDKATAWENLIYFISFLLGMKVNGGIKRHKCVPL